MEAEHVKLLINSFLFDRHPKLCRSVSSDALRKLSNRSRSRVAILKHVLGRNSYLLNSLRLWLLALLLVQNAPLAFAETADPMSALRRVYAGVLLIKEFHSACDQVAPENSSVHQAAFANFA